MGYKEASRLNDGQTRQGVYRDFGTVATEHRLNPFSLLIPLNKCRHKELYAPWKCEDERHGYEKCQYDE